MKHIYITRRIPHIATDMLTLAGYMVTENQDDEIPTDAALRKIVSKGGYSGVITLLTDHIDKHFFEAARGVQIVSNYAVGFNNIDLPAARAHRVAVTNTPVSNEHVAEFTLALILALATRLVEGNEFVKAGKYTGWSPSLFNGTDVKGKTLGLIGTGRIGNSVAERAYKALGMNIAYYDPIQNTHIEHELQAVRYGTVDELVPFADYISLHVPLIPETTHLMNAERFARMKPSAFLINTSRGPVVDEAALERALVRNVIRGAALDVFEFEPHISKTLRSLPNVIATPHIASARESAREEMAKLAAQNIIDFFDGKKPVGLVA